MYDAFGRGDAAGALEHFHPDVVLDAGRRMDVGIGRGREFVGETIGGWIAAFDDWSEEILELREGGGAVLAIALQRGRGRDSGIEVELRYGVLYEVEDGQITQMTLYPDTTEAQSAFDAVRTQAS